MIVLSGVLTPVAVALLITGLLTGNLAVLIGAVVASVAAGGFLVGAVRQRRAEVPDAATSGAATSESGAGAVAPFPPMAPQPPPEGDAAGGPSVVRES